MLRRVIAGSALTLVLVGVMVGCSAPPPIAATPTPSVDPLFEDDEAALAVASTVYDEYLAVRNLVENEGGVGVDRLAPLTSPAVLTDETGTVESFYQPLGMSSTGAVTSDSMTLVRLDDGPRADGSVMVLTLCEDASARTLTTSDGRVVTKGGAPRLAYRVTISVDPVAEADEGQEPVFLIAARQVIDDPALCGEVAPSG